MGNVDVDYVDACCCSRFFPACLGARTSASPCLEGLEMVIATGRHASPSSLAAIQLPLRRSELIRGNAEVAICWESAIALVSSFEIFADLAPSKNG